MGQRGWLIPEWYVAELPSKTDMNTASVFWGFALGVAIFCATQAAQQTRRSYRRSGRITAYCAMIWADWTASMVMGAISWCFLKDIIKPSFWIYFMIAFFWSFQIQLLLQIIINRIGLLMVVPHQATKLKWSVFGIILFINMSVFIIWIPARLQISQTWIDINNVWDRCEKAIFCVVDLCLNFYFVWLIRSRLINNGLTKYIPLYRANLALCCISMMLDVILIGLMSLPSGLVYLQFHPVAYLLKLQIEMMMAELITKVVKATSRDGDYNSNSAQKSKTGTGSVVPSGTKTTNAYTRGQNLTFVEQNTTQIGVGDRDSDVELQGRIRPDGDAMADDSGIRKTVQTTVKSTPRDDGERRDRQDMDFADTESQSSSTHKLHYNVV
ncbi:hypothetical protein G7046_g1264 [Stylonectria norvegica]|nr:hypothetical protein G7046_g1264 [Stylonectria norvegica]